MKKLLFMVCTLLFAQTLHTGDAMEKEPTIVIIDDAGGIASGRELGTYDDGTQFTHEFEFTDSEDETDEEEAILAEEELRPILKSAEGFVSRGPSPSPLRWSPNIELFTPEIDPREMLVMHRKPLSRRKRKLKAEARKRRREEEKGKPKKIFIVSPEERAEFTPLQLEWYLHKCKNLISRLERLAEIRNLSADEQKVLELYKSELLK